MENRTSGTAGEQASMPVSEVPTEITTSGSLSVPDSSSGKCVYFIRAAQLGVIKIGTAHCVHRRLPALQTGSPDKLVVAGIIRTGAADLLEKDLHHKFRAHRLHGEWFAPAPALLTYIKKHAERLVTDPQELAYLAQLRREAAQPGYLRPETIAEMKRYCGLT